MYDEYFGGKSRDVVSMALFLEDALKEKGRVKRHELIEKLSLVTK